MSEILVTCSILIKNNQVYRCAGVLFCFCSFPISHCMNRDRTSTCHFHFRLALDSPLNSKQIFKGVLSLDTLTKCKIVIL